MASQIVLEEAKTKGRFLGGFMGNYNGFTDIRLGNDDGFRMDLLTCEMRSDIMILEKKSKGVFLCLVYERSLA